MADRLAKRLRLARLQADITQEEMARRLDVTLRTYTRWERGETQRISTDALLRVAEETQHPLTFFFGGHK